MVEKLETEKVLRCDGKLVDEKEVRGIHYCNVGDCYCDESYDEFECNKCSFNK